MRRRGIALLAIVLAAVLAAPGPVAWATRRLPLMAV